MQRCPLTRVRYAQPKQEDTTAPGMTLAEVKRRYGIK